MSFFATPKSFKQDHDDDPYDFDLPSSSDDDDDGGKILTRSMIKDKLAFAAAAAPSKHTTSEKDVILAKASAYLKKMDRDSAPSAAASAPLQLEGEEESEIEEEEDKELVQPSLSSKSSKASRTSSPSSPSQRCCLTIDDLDDAILATPTTTILPAEAEAEAETAVVESAAAVPPPSLAATSAATQTTPLPPAPSSHPSSAGVIVETRSQGIQATGNEIGVQVELLTDAPTPPVILHKPCDCHCRHSIDTNKKPSQYNHNNKKTKKEIWQAYQTLLEEQQAHFLRTRMQIMELLQQAAAEKKESKRTKQGKRSQGQREEAK